MAWIIYKHTNIVNGKVYIGQTRKKAEERWRHDGRGYTYNKETRFAKAIIKYGWDNFRHEIIEDNIETQDKANLREIFWISKFNSYDFNFGYNMTIGGDFSSPEVRERASQTFKNNKRSEEKPIVCCELNKTFPNPMVAFEWFLSNGYTTQMKKNPIVRSLNKTNATCFGFHFCDLSILNDFHYLNQKEIDLRKGKRLKVICVDTGNIFNSLTECGEILNIKSQHLSRACKKHSPTHGLYFAYLDDYGELWEKYKKEKTYKNTLAVYCFELDKKWLSSADCCRELKISSGALSKLLKNQDPCSCYKTLDGKHFCKLSEVSFAKISDYPLVRNDSRAVICVETKDKFLSITKAEKEYGIKNILKCCKNWKYTAGGFHWCFENDIEKFNLIEQTPREFRNRLNKQVRNIETGNVFHSQAEAARSVLRDISSLKDAINNGTKCGGFHWEYVDGNNE